ncbi:MAG: hypothetical protein AAF485_05980 [Chloroflexota bacterium]
MRRKLVLIVGSLAVILALSAVTAFAWFSGPTVDTPVTVEEVTTISDQLEMDAPLEVVNPVLVVGEKGHSGGCPYNSAKLQMTEAEPADNLLEDQPLAQLD